MRISAIFSLGLVVFGPTYIIGILAIEEGEQQSFSYTPLQPEQKKTQNNDHIIFDILEATPTEDLISEIPIPEVPIKEAHITETPITETPISDDANRCSQGGDAWGWWEQPRGLRGGFTHPKQDQTFPAEQMASQTSGCRGVYNTNSGVIRHPMGGGNYENRQRCIWIIRATNLINITFVSFDIEKDRDYLYIRDGKDSESIVLARLSGNQLPRSLQTKNPSAHLTFTSGRYVNSSGFEVHWEPAVKTFYQISIGSDYEVKICFLFDSQPTNFYGSHVETGKFSIIITDFEKGIYQASMKINGVTEEDINTEFDLHVSSNISEINFRVRLSALPGPPTTIEMTDGMPQSVKISWIYSIKPENISFYVIQYWPRYSQEDYVEISGSNEMFYTIRGLTPSLEYEFRIAAVNKIGRGPPSETYYVTTKETGCGGEYNTSSGMIQYPLNGGKYQVHERCIWIIRPAYRLKITFTRFHTEARKDFLYIHDGESSGSDILVNLTGHLTPAKATLPSPVQTTSIAAYLLFTSDRYNTETGFKLQWEPTVETFYQIVVGNDYEVRINFTLNQEPSIYEWSYGPNFQDINNFIQIPINDNKFSTYLINLRNNHYQALLRITSITEDDIGTKFIFHASNALGEYNNRIMLSVFASPPSSLQIRSIMPMSIEISWNYDVEPGYISAYVIRYKARNASQDYIEISGLDIKLYTVRGLIPSTEYEFYILAVNMIGLGPPSEPKYVITSNIGCGGEYNSSSGIIRHPFNSTGYYERFNSTGYYEKFNNTRYNYDEDCTWIIRSADQIDITFVKFDLTMHSFGNDYLYIWDGISGEPALLRKLTGTALPGPLQITSNAAHLLFSSESYGIRLTGFQLQWKPVEVELIVNPNEKITLDCGIIGDYSFCVWEKDTHVIQVEDVYKGVYNGLGRPEHRDGNQCGIVVKQATIIDLGIWKCKVFIPGNILVGMKNVIITVAPTEGKVSTQQISVNAGDGQKIKCSVNAARPAVKINWFIDDRNITSEAKTVDILNHINETYMTISILSHIFNLVENGRTLHCTIGHHSYAEPELITVPITVVGFSPIQEQVEIFYQIPLHEDYEVFINFSANPPPTSIKLYNGANFQEMSLTHTPIEKDLKSGNYTAYFKIVNITEDDFDRRLMLQIENKISEANYSFMLSMDEKPFGCRKGFFTSYGSKHCYKYFGDVIRTWSEAKKKCEDEGLRLVQLTDNNAVDLRKYILDHFGNNAVWLGAQGDGHNFLWQISGSELKTKSSLWWPIWPGEWYTSNHCLILLAYDSNYRSHPGKPYLAFPCKKKLLTLCEDVIATTRLSSAVNRAVLPEGPCSGGWLFSNGSSQCFSFFNERLSWEKSNRKCEEVGQLTARPSDAVAVTLRKYLLDKYGTGRVWLGARGDGHQFVWQQSNGILSSSNKLWIKGKATHLFDPDWSYPGKRVTQNHCLTLMVNHTDWKQQPLHPYATYNCETPQYTLCEYEGCPVGFFKFNGSNQCFKFLPNVTLSWKNSSLKCNEEGLHLAQPDEKVAVVLRKYILNTYGAGHVWLGGSSDSTGQQVIWQSYGKDLVINRNNSLWYPGWGPDSRNDLTGKCLQLLVWEGALYDEPARPYALWQCFWPRHILCEGEPQ